MTPNNDLPEGAALTADLRRVEVTHRGQRALATQWTLRYGEWVALFSTVGDEDPVSTANHLLRDRAGRR